jgi:hypothetical protein
LRRLKFCYTSRFRRIDLGFKPLPNLPRKPAS